ncbi:hypothetical protein CYANOKiyG1_08670 [Okeania sp. KiyG1]|nr:hypothetical protein CYANOKiyG1_08670 [Okeania sp. KiyG1]
MIILLIKRIFSLKNDMETFKTNMATLYFLKIIKSLKHNLRKGTNHSSYVSNNDKIIHYM